MRRTFVHLLGVAVTVACITCHASAGETPALEAGRQALAARRFSEAEANARRHLAQESGSEAAAVLRARALLGLNQPFEAALSLESFLERNDAAVEAMTVYAEILSGLGRDVAGAITALKRASALRPSDPMVWRDLGRLYLRRGEGAPAVEAFRRALEAAPSDPVLMAGLGTALTVNGQQEHATAWFERAAQAGGANPIVLFLIADGYLAAQRYSEAAAWYDRGLRLAPEFAESWFQRARARQGAGDIAGAIRDAEHALAAGASPREARTLLASLHREAGNAEAAARYTADLQALSQSENAALEQRRRIRTALREAEPLVRQGRCAEAIPLYERVAAELPTFYEAWFALGACYTTQRRFADAEKALRRHVEYQSHSADGHAALGVALLAQGRGEEGLAALRRASELEPANPGFAAETAQAEARLGRREEALATLRAGLQRMPRDPQLEEAHAGLLLDCGSERRCREELAAAWKQTKDSLPYWKAVTRLMLADGNASDALRGLVAELVRRFPRDAEAHLLAGQYYYGVAQYDVAAREGAAAAELGASSGQAVDGLALQAAAADARRDGAAAKRLYAAAHQLNRNIAAKRPRASVAYVVHLEQSGGEKEARAILDEVLGWTPDYAPARLRRALLNAAAGLADAAVSDALAAARSAGRDVDLERAARALLVRTYLAQGRKDLASEHQQWIEKHASAAR